MIKEQSDRMEEYLLKQVFCKAWFRSSVPVLDESRFYIRREAEGRFKIIYNGNYATIIDEGFQISNIYGREPREVYHLREIQQLLGECKTQHQYFEQNARSILN